MALGFNKVLKMATKENMTGNEIKGANLLKPQCPKSITSIHFYHAWYLLLHIVAHLGENILPC
jgi:hypothetical protein